MLAPTYFNHIYNIPFAITITNYCDHKVNVISFYT